MLFAVQNTPDVDVEEFEELERLLSVHHLQAEQIGRRNRNASIAGRFGGGGIAIDEIAFAERVKEIAQAARLHAGMDWRQTAPDGGAIDHLLVERNDASAAETEIVLQAPSGAFDLGCSGAAAQLPRQFVALCQPGCAERMPFRQQPARWVGDDFATIGVVAVFDKGFGTAPFTETECFVGDQFVLSETAVQFDHVDVAGTQTRG
jgi:hypothetical protein